jgi:hypothetical protein
MQGLVTVEYYLAYVLLFINCICACMYSVPVQMLNNLFFDLIMLILSLLFVKIVQFYLKIRVYVCVRLNNNKKIDSTKKYMS